MKAQIGPLKQLQLNLFREFRHASSTVHELNYLFWECTLKCNLMCLHCGSDCKSEGISRDMPLEDFMKVLRSVKKVLDPHKVTIVLTGGEPLLRKDLEECGLAFYREEFPWGLVTNGYAMTDNRFESLLRSGLRSMTVSLDGLKESHNWLRRKDDSFEKALHAITIAAHVKDIEFDVVTCVNQKNFKELSEIRELLVENGVKHWRLFTIFPKGRAAGNSELDLSNEQFRQLMEFIKKTRRQKRISAAFSCEGFLGNYENEVRSSMFFCRAGVTVGSVLADGSISACPSLRNDFIQGNVYNDDFIEIWNSKFQIMRDRSWTRTGICASCNSYSWCEGNGLHLRDQKTGDLLRCHYQMLINP